jgi:colanic acid biosynthesis glycosyl transferase WcaI
MKLLVQSMNFSPELTGIGKYSGELVDELVTAGHEVTVVCAPPYYPGWKVPAGHRRWIWAVQRPAPGLRIVRCPLWVPARPSGLRRLLHQASFALSSAPVMLWLGLRWRPQVVFSVLPAMMTVPAARLAARLAGARSWLHVQDLELEAAFELGLLRGRFARLLLQRLESALLRRFDHVSTLSAPMLGRLRDKGIAQRRMDLLPNWAGAHGEAALDTMAGLRAELGLPPAAKVVLFSGTMNRKQGLEVVLEAALRLEHRRDIVFLLCGEGDQRALLEHAAAGRGNVRFGPLQPVQRLSALLAMAEVHVLPQRRAASDLVLPSKLAGMMSSGRPIVATAPRDSEVARLLRGCGVIVEPGDPEALALAVAALCDDPDRGHRLGLAAWVRAEMAFSRVEVMERVQDRLSALLAPGAFSAREERAQLRAEQRQARRRVAPALGEAGAASAPRASGGGAAAVAPSGAGTTGARP